jgi:hypothetical protein
VCGGTVQGIAGFDRSELAIDGSQGLSPKLPATALRGLDLEVLAAVATGGGLRDGAEPSVVDRLAASDTRPIRTDLGPIERGSDRSPAGDLGFTQAVKQRSIPLLG